MSTTPSDARPRSRQFSRSHIKFGFAIGNHQSFADIDGSINGTDTCGQQLPVLLHETGRVSAGAVFGLGELHFQVADRIDCRSLLDVMSQTNPDFAAGSHVNVHASRGGNVIPLSLPGKELDYKNKHYWCRPPSISLADVGQCNLADVRPARPLVK
jgi:hypothetical protein